MKNIIYISILALSLFGCSKDMLDRTPITNKVVENFYKTPEDAAQALTACYNVLTWEATTPIQLIAGIASDELFGGAGASDGDGFVRYDRFVAQPETSVNQSIWQQYYAGITRANVLLENIDNVNWGTKTALKTQYTAEAKFLRAYFYFNLTRMFGKVPLILKTAKANDVVTVAAVDDVYKQIVSDLMYGADNLAATKWVANSADYGRVTKWAAESMLARVYLFYSGYYNTPKIGDLDKEKTLAYLNDVIKNSGHGLVASYSSLWVVSSAYSKVAYAGEGNQEVVFAIKYTIANNNNNTDGSGLWQRMIGPRSYNKAPYGQGWGAGTVNPSMWNAYTDANDTRKKANILNWDEEGRTYDGVSDQRQYTGYNVKKYENYCKTDGQTNAVDLGSKEWQFDGYEDFIEIRYADVLLMAAELDATNALSYLNMVRTRSGASASPSAGIADIMSERKLEFAFEGLRYWDLLRQCGTSFDPLVNAIKNESSTSKFYVNGQNAAHVKGLFQVPPAEISLMNLQESAFEQNILYKDNSVVGNY